MAYVGFYGNFLLYISFREYQRKTNWFRRDNLMVDPHTRLSNGHQNMVKYSFSFLLLLHSPLHTRSGVRSETSVITVSVAVLMVPCRHFPHCRLVDSVVRLLGGLFRLLQLDKQLYPAGKYLTAENNWEMVRHLCAPLWLQRKIAIVGAIRDDEHQRASLSTRQTILQAKQIIHLLILLAFVFSGP